jgi:hypothetical protein
MTALLFVSGRKYGKRGRIRKRKRGKMRKKMEKEMENKKLENRGRERRQRN